MGYVSIGTEIVIPSAGETIVLPSAKATFSAPLFDATCLVLAGGIPKNPSFALPYLRQYTLLDPKEQGELRRWEKIVS